MTLKSRVSTRIAARFCAAILLTTGVAVAVNAPPASAAEDNGANCSVSVPGSFPSDSRLPDPFQRIDGTRITAQSQWECRRAEIRELAERFVYGDKPAKPQTVTGSVTSTNITVNVSHNGRSASFSASVQLPSGTGPFPAVIVYGGFGADTNTIRSTGAAVINYDPMVVGREGSARAPSWPVRSTSASPLPCRSSRAAPEWEPSGPSPRNRAPSR